MKKLWAASEITELRLDPTCRSNPPQPQDHRATGQAKASSLYLSLRLSMKRLVKDFTLSTRAP